MKLVLTDFNHKSTKRLLSSLTQAQIPYVHVNISYDGWDQTNLRNPFAAAIGAIGQPDLDLHYNQIQVPEYYEIRNADGVRAKILLGDLVKGYIYYAPSSSRLVREVQWLDRSGKLALSHRYNRQGFKFADALFNPEGKEIKTIFYREDGKKVLTFDKTSQVIIQEREGGPKVYQNLTEFVLAYIHQVLKEETPSVDELIYNSLSTPFFVSNLLQAVPGSLYFQEGIGDSLPGNLDIILKGGTPTRRILFENMKVMTKAKKLGGHQKVVLSYLGAIERFRRENDFRPKLLTITRSDEIELSEPVGSKLGNMSWTIAAPTEASDKLRAFANAHPQVKVIEGMPLSDIDEYLANHDIYLDLNQGGEVNNCIQRAYLEGLLVVGYKPVIKSPSYELVLETEGEVLDVLQRSDKQVAMKVLREKRGKPAQPVDYQEAFL